MFNADVPEEDIVGAIQRLTDKYEHEDFAFQLNKAAGGYQFLTKPAYQASIGIMLKQQSKKRLSTSAMETLAIISYKQPVSKTEVETIRGVNCDYAVQKLLDKGLIEITGKAETIGRPMLYGSLAKRPPATRSAGFSWENWLSVRLSAAKASTLLAFKASTAFG